MSERNSLGVRCAVESRSSLTSCLTPPRARLGTVVAGFIGSHMALRVTERPDRMVGWENRNDLRNRTNLEDIRSAARTKRHARVVGVPITEGDLRNRPLPAEQ